MHVHLEKQEPEMLDAATIEAIKVAEAERDRGESYTFEEALENARKNYEAWRESQKVAASL